MKEYFATYSVSGLVSVRIIADSVVEVLERIKLKGQHWIDDSRTDAEEAFIDRDFEDDWSEYEWEDIQETMEDHGYQIVLYQQNDWMIWERKFDNLK